VLDTMRGAVRRLSLRGSFQVDTVSNDGRRLFLIQLLADGEYQIRLYDLRRRQLGPVLREKGEEEEMLGVAQSQLGTRDGRKLLTLYLDTRRHTAFVHSLDLRTSVPICIDLPSGRGRMAELRQYSLALSDDGRKLFAANPALGLVAEIDLAEQRVIRHAVSWPFPLARLGAPRAAASADGRTLAFASGRYVWTYDVAYGLVRGPVRVAGKVAGIGFGGDWRRLYVAPATGRLVSLRVRT
jgi:hypothetical protein